MSPVTVRFSPTAAELAAIRTAIIKSRPRLSLPLTLALSAGYILQGVLQLTNPRGGQLHLWLGCIFVVCGVSYAPLWWATSGRMNLAFAKPEHEIDLRIDDAGLTLAGSEKSIPWRRITKILDVSDAFVFERFWGRRVAILTRALPDGGRALWATLDEKLTATRYLVRTTSGLRRIINELER